MFIRVNAVWTIFFVRITRIYSIKNYAPKTNNFGWYLQLIKEKSMSLLFNINSTKSTAVMHSYFDKLLWSSSVISMNYSLFIYPAVPSKSLMLSYLLLILMTSNNSSCNTSLTSGTLYLTFSRSGKKLNPNCNNK